MKLFFMKRKPAPQLDSKFSAPDLPDCSNVFAALSGAPALAGFCGSALSGADGFQAGKAIMGGKNQKKQKRFHFKSP